MLLWLKPRSALKRELIEAKLEIKLLHRMNAEQERTIRALMAAQKKPRDWKGRFAPRKEIENV